MQQPITLYLDLEEGFKPDLATVARAALAFDAAIKEIAFVLDPSLDIRLELESGTEGSLKLNSLMKSIKDGVTDKRVLKAVAFAIACWFVNDVRAYFSEQLIESVIKKETNEVLTDEEISRIAEEVVKALKGKVGEKQVQKVFEELQRDEAIRGVGVTTIPDNKPSEIVPRAEFRSRSASEVVQEVQQIRTRVSNETVTLISPVLLASNRRWRFFSNNLEFGASVKDQEFLERLLSGQEPVPMVAGIAMDVTIETKEENVGGVWTIKERNILRVIRTWPVPKQASLDLSSGHQQGGDNAQ